MDAGSWVGIGAVCVAGVQAAIYWQQKKAQVQANKQALFDRRYQIYKTVHSKVSGYIEAKGRGTKANVREALDDAVQEAEFLFPDTTARHLALIRDCVLRHKDALPPIVYDFYAEIIESPETPETIKTMRQLTALFDDLPKHLEVMRLSQ